MRFIDEAIFRVAAGKGGDGCVSFRREKYVPKGGPDGGDGGKGGSAILKVYPGISTLLDLRQKKHYNAQAGQRGRGKNQHGKYGEDIIIKVPRGTLVFNNETGELLSDLIEPEQLFIAAKGGIGGKGNARFCTSTRQAPDFAQNGKPGETLEIRLELKLLADVGLVGFPNAGKSTFLSVVSAARPKIADYPFTTLQPNLGIVPYGDYKQFVVADIPGLIEGASEGRGLGYRFLKHIERTKILLFLIDCTDEQPEITYKALLSELKKFNKALLEKPRLIAFSKMDIFISNDIQKLPDIIDGIKCTPISSVTREGIDLLIRNIVPFLQDG